MLYFRERILSPQIFILSSRAQDHKTKAGDQTQIWSPFQPIRCLRFESGHQTQFYDLGPRWDSQKFYNDRAKYPKSRILSKPETWMFSVLLYYYKTLPKLKLPNSRNQILIKSPQLSWSQDHKTVISRIWSPFQPIRCLRFESGLQH
jgi:hypothetical protein